MRGNRYYRDKCNNKESKGQATRSGYCSRWSWAQASSHQHGGGRSINVYNASNQNIISGGVLRGPAPLSLYWEFGGTSLSGVLGSRGRLGIFWWPASLALCRRFTSRRVLLRILGLCKKSSRDEKERERKGVSKAGVLWEASPFSSSRQPLGKLRVQTRTRPQRSSCFCCPWDDRALVSRVKVGRLKWKSAHGMG